MPEAATGWLIPAVLAAGFFQNPRPVPAQPAVGPLLESGSRLAIAGDSITEQKLYSRYIELYLDVCMPALDVRVMQFGWSGERAGGFLARMENDLLPFHPDVVTLCYGMNDGLYKPFTPAVGQTYEQAMTAIVERIEKAGARVVVGSPGMVDPDTFTKNGLAPEVYNECLGRLREIARGVAEQQGARFADLYGDLHEVMLKAKARLGRKYHVCGLDGIHPARNGHLVMAQTFLEALGLDGNIGTISVIFDGKRITRATASAGHTIVEISGNRVTVESRRWPFCLTGDGVSPESTRSIAPSLPFNERLNRLTLRVDRLGAHRAVVTWGGESRPFSRRDLERGVNLPAFFHENPFVEPFEEIEKRVLEKQRFETVMVKSAVASFRAQRRMLGPDPEAEKAWGRLYQRFLAKADRLDREAKAAVVPVRHTIEILPDPGEPGEGGG